MSPGLVSNYFTVVNAPKCCYHKDKKQIQNSNIDFCVVCICLLSHVTEILIDDKREMTITNYKCTRRGKSAVDSDYMTMMLKINLNVLPHKPQRVEMFH